MAIIETTALTHRYGHATALSEVDLSVQEGSVYALLGANGAGKSTLLRILAGMQRPTSGRVAILGMEPSELTIAERSTISYVAEGMELPKWMTLRQLEEYVGPLYDRWDATLADALRDQFRLDPARRLGTLSRGELMKAALLCALAPHPRVLLMDEPFTGVDVVVKDQLVRGLLDSVGQEGCTIVIASHDLAELEPLADWVGFLDASRLRLSEPMESIRDQFLRVEVTGANLLAPSFTIPSTWMSLERSDSRVAFVVRSGDGGWNTGVQGVFPPSARIETRSASLREVFVGLATTPFPRRVAAVAS